MFFPNILNQKMSNIFNRLDLHVYTIYLISSTYVCTPSTQNTPCTGAQQGGASQLAPRTTPLPQYLCSCPPGQLPQVVAVQPAHVEEPGTEELIIGALEPQTGNHFTDKTLFVYTDHVRGLILHACWEVVTLGLYSLLQAQIHCTKGSDTILQV